MYMFYALAVSALTTFCLETGVAMRLFRKIAAVREATMEGKMQVMIGSPDLIIWERFTNLLESKDLSLVRFQSIQQACNALEQDNVLLIFCENRLADGTYEDLLTAAKSVKSQARIVVTGLDSDQFDALGYCRARQLGAFDVLRKSYGIKDLEWVVICAIRDQAGVRTAPAWHSPTNAVASLSS